MTNPNSSSSRRKPAITSRRAFLTGTATLVCSGLSACAQSSDDRFLQVDTVAQRAVRKGEVPGIVLAVGHQGQIVHRYVCGNRSLVPDRETMTWDTRFDMASLTKPTMTALSIMQLVERGQVGLDEPVSRYLPAFAANGKAPVTIRLLLTHYSGLPPDLSLDDAWNGKAEAVHRAMTSSLVNPPADKFVYSDINFITLGLVVEKVSGLSLDAYVQKEILGPLGMTESGYLPDPSLKIIIAPTQYDGHGMMLRGVVHDPTARRMGGVAGHAGLFSDAHDMCLYAQALLDRLAGRPSAFPLRRETLQQMTSPQQPQGKAELRGIGWDIATHYSSPRGRFFSHTSFGHTGFTGTSLWIDPVSDSYVLILTNRVHPNGSGNVSQLRYDIATEAAHALGLYDRA
ncbi:serine hydrolase [Gluconobacter oxydans]|uniref:serine hydrolase domain-containing protein n=1 Tax=Gluconobacter oxydans TaxID=442 RepID=UPI00062C934F|nr:serine hydrolase domain-containing protein [Gluconobacter oxydans]